MRGLRTQETDKFNRFFTLVQVEARKQNSVFFADAGDGNEFETAIMEGENMMGWLIPKEHISEFEALWEESKVDDSWSDFFKWAVWSRKGDKVEISFED